LKWRAFPLHPETPKEGMTLEKLFQGRLVNIQEVMARLKRVAEAEGLPLGERKMTFNSRLAQELGKWAEAKGKGEAFDQAAFRAYFVEGINIALIPELLKLAESVGLPEEEAKDVLQTRSFREVVDSDWERARKLGITMVPTFMVDGHAMVGAQPYEAMERFMKAHNIPKRNP